MHTGTARRPQEWRSVRDADTCEVIIEATNANLDPEPVHVKWRRGYLPRAVREVIFGVGSVNQMSDYFEERRMPQVILSDRIAVVHHHPNLTSRFVSCCPRCWGKI